MDKCHENNDDNRMAMAIHEPMFVDINLYDMDGKAICMITLANYEDANFEFVGKDVETIYFKCFREERNELPETEER